MSEWREQKISGEENLPWMMPRLIMFGWATDSSSHLRTTSTFSVEVAFDKSETSRLLNQCI